MLTPHMRSPHILHLVRQRKFNKFQILIYIYLKTQTLNTDCKPHFQTPHVYIPVTNVAICFKSIHFPVCFLLFFSAISQEKKIHSRSFAHMAFQSSPVLIQGGEKHLHNTHTGIKIQFQKCLSKFLKNCNVRDNFSQVFSGKWLEKKLNGQSDIFFLASWQSSIL